jgi:hypothetical protein
MARHETGRLRLLWPRMMSKSAPACLVCWVFGLQLRCGVVVGRMASHQCCLHVQLRRMFRSGSCLISAILESHS